MKKRISSMSDVYFNYGYEYVKNRLAEKRQAIITQKLSGLSLALLGALSVPAMNMDVTAALIFVPAGLYLVFTKKLFLNY